MYINSSWASKISGVRVIPSSSNHSSAEGRIKHSNTVAHNKVLLLLPSLRSHSCPLTKSRLLLQERSQTVLLTTLNQLLMTPHQMKVLKTCPQWSLKKISMSLSWRCFESLLTCTKRLLWMPLLACMDNLQYIVSHAWSTSKPSTCG